ncbi:MAG: PrsW family glutamic-type intramembrane protease [Aulosira sp. ZfuVER01]|nr:PrsW family glutamic-type intramembrane protease [Aulosira sp. ZfuVER01]MDZ8000110.1 PrsW family glutamic-type intramembrane protease [Aulosira sp. DedVER01a]MDZ8055024.1 PrsW family glutamic-type intramembrane protease [Aulosira sp. ZfuCHP01]
MADSLLLLWAVIPPLLLLVYYYYRVLTAPSLFRLLLLFICGAISGFVALSLEVAFETVANWFVNWQQIKYSLPGIALRQLVEIGPIEEGCKLVTVIVTTYYLQRRYQLRPSTVFLFTIAVALGFTAQENWIYLYYNTASILDRSIGTLVHAMFSAPWGYALGMRLNQNRNLLFRAWLNSVVCHALVNFLSSAWRYSPPLHFFSYGLFPFLLWMFWRMEQLLRRVEGKPPITVISAYTLQHRYWQRGLVVFALMLGGNAIFGLFLLARNLSPLSWQQLFYPRVLWFILSRFLFNLNFAVIAWLIYRYLRRQGQRRDF